MVDDSGQTINPVGQRTSSGMDANVAGALSYVLGIITGIIFYVIEKENEFVRFSAMQSILLNVAWIVFWVAYNIVGAILWRVPVIGVIWGVLSIIIGLVLSLGFFVLWIYLIVKAFQGQKVLLPYIGAMAEKNSRKAA